MWIDGDCEERGGGEVVGLRFEVFPLTDGEAVEEEEEGFGMAS